MPRALLSVSDKTGVVELGRGLVARGYELVSTGGTARALGDAGLPVTNVSLVTGFPELMDGRVKTLHPNIHAGILARRNRADDLHAIARHGIAPIDIVVVNLYPFRETAEKPDVALDELMEQIDIGGPSMVRAAAKNFRDVLVVVDPADYLLVLAALDEGPTSTFRYVLMIKAFAHTAEYDTTIATVLGRRSDDELGIRPTIEPADTFSLELEKARALRYGENPNQAAAFYRPRGSSPRWTMLQGKELSYTNLLDLDAAARIVGEFTEPAAVVIKHTNPCGVATGQSAADAYVRARDADALAAFGGIVGLNRPVDVDAANAVVATFIEAVIAPSIAEEAGAVLARKDKMRVVALSAGAGQTNDVRSVLDGFLVQVVDRVDEARHPWPQADMPRVATKRAPTAAEWTALRFAWRVCAHVKSNAVVFTSADRTLAIGAGQMSRVDAVKVAVMKARDSGSELAGSVAASDAFFPFRDGLDTIAGAGATAVVQPGGSVRDAEVIAAADEHNLAMVFTGRRHFRH